MKHLVIFTTIFDDWGGSEELWARAIPYWQQAGHRVTVVKDKINRKHPQYVALAQSGVQLVDFSSWSDKIYRLMFLILKPFEAKFPVLRKWLPQLHELYARKIAQVQPHMVVVAQGINFDGLLVADALRRRQLPYMVIAQKAVEFYWPYRVFRADMRLALQQARMNYFVSQHNRQLTEEQFAVALPNAQVVFNPVKTGTRVLPFPTTSPVWRLACVGRLFLQDKGQDILLRILSQDKWRSRPIEVDFIGSGVDEEGLKELAAFLNVQQVRFIGFQSDIEQLWSQYHALVLPSRAEGMPLAVMEAMGLGRTVIVSKAGGNAELVTDGVNGFIGECSFDDFDATMERAWQARDRWHSLGEAAVQTIRDRVPAVPEATFAQHVLDSL